MSDVPEISTPMPKKVKRACVLLIVLPAWKLAVLTFIVILATARGHEIDEVGQMALGLMLALYTPGVILALVASSKLRSRKKTGRILGFVALVLLLMPPDLITLVLIVLAGVSMLDRETSNYLLDLPRPERTRPNV